MARAGAIVWTPTMDELVGTMPDKTVADRLGLKEQSVRYRRRRLGLPTYRSSKAPITLPCANCGKVMERKHRDLTRSAKLYCSHQCASAGQKRRDSDMLRYGPGWKNVRARVRQRDKVCRACGEPPGATALHVHHLKPYRYGGTNLLANLVALCDSCHHIVEAVTTSVLASIPIDVSLDASTLTITVDGKVRWHASVHGADSPTEGGSTAS